MTPIIAPPLKQRFFNASWWSIGGHVISQVLRLGGNLIMTRLLVPDMFGVMALAYVYIIGLTLFSDLGVNQNVIQSRRGNDSVFLNTAWAVKILRGVVICLLALVISYGLHLAIVRQIMTPDTVYADHRLPEVLAVLSLTVLIQGFESNRMALAWRNLQLRSVTLLEITSQTVTVLSMLAWALMVERSVWALVAGTIIGQLAKTVLSHTMLSGFGDRWAWDTKALAEIIGFGKWVFFSSILGFLVMNGDRLILGGLVGPDILGQYSIAVLLAVAMQQLMSRFFAAAAFPALSEVVRNNPDRLKIAYYKIRSRIDPLVLLVSGGLYVLGTPVIHILYDERYWNAGPMLEILSLALIASRYELTEQCYLALGLPKWLTLQNVVRIAVLYSTVPLAYSMYQLPGAIWMIVLSRFAVLPLTFFLKSRLQILDLKKEFIVLPFFLLGFLCGEIVLALFSA